MRNLNNLVKERVIRLAAQRAGISDSKAGLTVLDFGCGMGGDIQKWFKNGVKLGRYVGVDIAKESLVKFGRDRISRIPGKTLVTHLICADIGSQSLSDQGTELDVHTWEKGSSGMNAPGVWASMAAPLSKADVFDVASCQFALHYMFQTQAKANHFFSEMGRHVKVGGLFVATTIDARVIADLVAQKESEPIDSASLYAEHMSQNMGPKRELVIRNELNDVLLRISFTQDNWNRLKCTPQEYAKGKAHMDATNRNSSKQKNNIKDALKAEKDAYEHTFGIQYNFALLDQSDATAVDAPEWLVPVGEPLEALAAYHGFRVKLVENFHQFLMQGIHTKASVAMSAASQLKMSELSKDLKEHGVYNYKKTITPAEWELSRLYCVLVFEKQK